MPASWSPNADQQSQGTEYKLLLHWETHWT